MGTLKENKLNKKTILIISGGIEAVPGIYLAKKMGLKVVVSDIDPNAPGFTIADDSILASTYDVKGTVEAATDYNKNVRPINGVMCIAADVPLTVASVASALGLCGIAIESAILATDKFAMKQKLLADHINVPWFSQVKSVDHLRKFVEKCKFPLILKPVDSRGARGVLRLSSDIDLDWAYIHSLGYSPTGQVMVEQFLSGPQISTESIMIDGIAYTPGFADRNYEYLERYSPHMIENGGELPSHLSKDMQKSVCNLVQRAAISMGIINGVVKGDVVIFKGQPYIIELAARLSGGYFCTHEIPLNTGVNFVEQAIRMSLGETLSPSNLIPKYQRYVTQRYYFPKPGRVISIRGYEKVKQRSGIFLCEIRVKIGDIVGPIDSHPARAGVVIATGESREESIERACNAIRDITIETVPVDYK